MAQSPASFMYMHFSLNRYLISGEELDSATPPFGTAIGSETSPLVSATAEIKSHSNSVFDVTLRLNIAEGWHINANPAGQDNLIPTTITVDTDIPLEIVDIAYPKGRSTRFEFSSESLNVYEESLTIPLRLKQKSDVKDDKTVPMTLQLTYQLCNETECLLPETLNISLKLPR